MSWVLPYLYRYRWNSTAVLYTGGPASARPYLPGPDTVSCAFAPRWPYRPGTLCQPFTDSTTWPMPRPTASAAAAAALDMHPGAVITNFRPVSSGMFFTSHSALSWISPSNGSEVFWNAARKSAGTGSPSGHQAPVVVEASNTIPSTSAGLTPASSMALRMARMAHAPMLFCGSPSQRRSVGECPTPTAATRPRWGHTPGLSVIRNNPAAEG